MKSKRGHVAFITGLVLDEYFAMRGYYENLDASPNPLNCIKTIQLMDEATQIACGGFDHAGQFETSLLSALYPEHVDFARTGWNTEWFAKPSTKASRELGERMATLAEASLARIIQ